jgi:hypothetical protein
VHCGVCRVPIYGVDCTRIVNGGVHCPGRGAGYAFDAEPRLIEKAVEHAPGKGSVRATALQRKVDQNLAPAALRIRVHPRRP